MEKNLDYSQILNLECLRYKRHLKRDAYDQDKFQAHWPVLEMPTLN